MKRHNCNKQPQPTGPFRDSFVYVVVVAQLKAEVKDVALSENFEACNDLEKRIRDVEAGILSYKEIDGASFALFG